MPDRQQIIDAGYAALIEREVALAQALATYSKTVARIEATYAKTLADAVASDD